MSLGRCGLLASTTVRLSAAAPRVDRGAVHPDEMLPSAKCFAAENAQPVRRNLSASRVLVATVRCGRRCVASSALTAGGESRQPAGRRWIVFERFCHGYSRV
jgi:hypothetical protein